MIEKEIILYNDIFMVKMKVLVKPTTQTTNFINVLSIKFQKSKQKFRLNCKKITLKNSSLLYYNLTVLNL